MIYFDAKLVKGLQAKKINGRYTIEQALTLLLSNSGLSFVKDKNGNYQIKKGASVGTLATAIVASEDLKDGSAADGYRVDEISAVGPWQGRTLQETPYSMSVVSGSLIENVQATTADQIYKMNPLTQLTKPAEHFDIVEVHMRGFVASFVNNGISRQKKDWDNQIVMEEIAQIEILSGLSGFIYGGDNIGGSLNYISKRPTDERLNNISFGNTSGSNLYLHGDFGGQFDADGIFGYRINAVVQDGETQVEHKSIKRNSINTVFDWQLTDNLLIEINASKRDYHFKGDPGLWFLSGGVKRPKADFIDNNKLWGQKWTMTHNISKRLGASMHWQLNDNLTLRGAYRTDETKKALTITHRTIQQDNTYNINFATTSEHGSRKHTGSGGYLFADFTFSTGDIEHKLTAGWQSSKTQAEWPENLWANPLSFQGLSLLTPTYLDKPDWSDHDSGKSRVHNLRSSDNFTIGNDISFNEQWSALVGISKVELSHGQFSDEMFKDSALTPNIALIYQPIDNVTSYISFNEGLEAGGMAEDRYETLEVINAGEVMKPLMSSQLELGVKINIGDILLTAALFEIDKPFEYYQMVNNSQYKFVQDGRQVHKGLEFTATGKLTENLSLVGGFTLLDAQTKNNKENPELEGKSPRGVAEQMFKLYGEYNITAIPGLVVNGGFSHTGNAYGDSMNTDKIEAYTLFDMGARYNLDIAATAVTLRLNINNLTDECYWANSAFLGERRTISASVSVAF